MERHRDYDRDADRQHDRPRSDRRSTRGRDYADEPDKPSRERERERDRERERERDLRDRDRGERSSYKDRDRDLDSRDRYQDRPRDRDREIEHERYRDRGRDREKDRSAVSVAFSRPATYDPRLAQRTAQRQHRGNGYDDDDDYHYEDNARSKQLKDELGLSDEEQNDDLRSSTGLRAGVSSATGNRDAQKLQTQYDQALKELQTARDNEQKAQESLSKLQLLSKSQTAILKTTMIKKIQEKEDLLDEMNGIIKELEGKLQAAGAAVEPYTPSQPRTAESSSSSAASVESDAIAEIGAMKAEIDRLTDENKSLKQNATKAGNDPKSPSKQTVETDIVSKDKFEKLEAEKRALAQQLKDSQQQVKTLQDATPAISPPPAPALAPTSTPNNAEMSILQQKLAEAESAHQKAQKAIQKLEKDLAAAVHSQAAASSEAAKANSAAGEATKEKLKKEENLLAQVKKLETQVNDLQNQLDEKVKELQTKEAGWEERHSKLKTTAETELNKIKEQAKKAIIDLKKKLESTSKNHQQKQKALADLQIQLRKQKTDFVSLKSQITNQNQQFPIMAKQLAEKVTQRIQKQADAMAGVVENYKREVKERKRLFNLVQELKGNIRVLCRVRPISKSEISNGSKMICKFTPEEITLAGEKGKMKSWEFDRVFDMHSTQDQVFNEVKPLVTSILDGYSVCIFAYGQTGSGKTFTMAGPSESPGINTRSLQELFERKNHRAKEYQDEITVSIMEIYNEQIRDLIAQDVANTNLQVRQGPTGNFVPGLTTVPVQSLDEVFELIKRGNKNRSTHATDMNEHSSRSHSILSIQLKSINLVTSTVANGKLFLVDLAGSERLSKTGAEGQRLKEAQNINKSLSALGDVIAARASKAKHVPYRNSSLTYLLQDALGGDSKTLMVACASPVDYNSDESFCTLNFASRTRSVEMGKATKNVSQTSVKDKE